MKKNKKGFVFVETIVVVAVLTVSLLMVYSTYSAVMIKEKKRIRYNDSVYLYRTYYLSKFFKNFRLDTVASGLRQTGNIRVITEFGCTDSIFINEADNKGFCNSMLDSLHVSNLYLTYNDISFLQDCRDTRGRCEALVQVRPAAAEYLKTIGGKGNAGYRIVVEFSENKDGSRCVGDTCQYYYTTLSLGAL